MVWKLPDILYEINGISVIFRVCLAMILGGILGIERGRKHRPAGFRTYMLVCLGTTVVMMTNQYAYEQFGVGDPVRMGAQVISGIGFLGAGTIIVTGHNQVRGLTTAAGLWAAACIGLAIGIGFYEGAIIGGLAVILIMICFHWVDGLLVGKNRRIELYVETENMKELSIFLKEVKQQGLEIGNVLTDMPSDQEHNGFGAILMIKGQKRICHEEIVDQLKELPGVRHLEEI